MPLRVSLLVQVKEEQSAARPRGAALRAGSRASRPRAQPARHSGTATHTRPAELRGVGSSADIRIVVTDGKALRSRGQVWGGVISGGLLALLGVAALVNDAIAEGVFLLLVAATITAMLAIWTAMWLSPTGVRVRNPFSTFALRWDEIARFRIGRWKLLSACLIIDTHDGRSYHVFAIEVPNINLLKKDAREREIARQLNDRLQQQNGAAGSA